jgi:hypothetical protein
MLHYLARFRADPKKIRVSWQATDYGWRATISRRSDGHLIAWLTELDPMSCIEALFGSHLVEGVDGIDPGMDRAYPHPWGPLGANVLACEDYATSSPASGSSSSSPSMTGSGTQRQL